MKTAVRIAAVALAALACSEELRAEKVSKSVPNGWIEDFSAAKEQAAKEKKNILVAFSGSDWCGWCVRMDKEVYSDMKFIRNAKNDFVLVMIDSPRDKSILSELALKQNGGLVEKFRVRGYPCSVLTAADGTEIKRFSGYQRGGPEEFLKQLKEAAGKAAPQN